MILLNKYLIISININGELGINISPYDQNSNYKSLYYKYYYL